MEGDTIGNCDGFQVGENAQKVRKPLTN